MSKTWKNILFGILFLAIACGAMYYNNYQGYKHGQIDAARGHIEYTIISERVIHIMGDAPLPDTRLTPIPEKEDKK